MSNMNAFIDYLKEGMKTNKFNNITLANELMNVYGAMFAGNECNTSIFQYFKTAEFLNTDPLDLNLHILKMLNNNNDINSKIPLPYYSNVFNEVPEEIVNEKMIEFESLIKDNYLQKLFGISYVSIIRQLCKNEKCMKVCSTMTCENENYLKIMIKESNEFKMKIFDKFCYKQIKFACHDCKTVFDDYKIREPAKFINLPKYLTIKIRSEVKVHKSGKEKTEYVNGAKLYLPDIKSFNIGETNYEITGIVCIKEKDSYYSILYKNGKFHNNFDSTIISNEYSFVESAYILYYEKKRMNK